MMKLFSVASSTLILLLTTTASADLVHQWKFNGFATDSVGEAHGTLSGGAEIVDGRLSVDGVSGSLFRTSSLGAPLNEKTLISWVSLNDVTHSSRGSALTVQNNAAGSIFDAIVYGEVAAQKWMAGSNGFVRTENPQTYGVEESVGEPGEVMIGIVYAADNSISLYRDGSLYGSYTKNTLQPFNADATVQIGPRHGGHPDVFDGFINEARIYDTALDASALNDIFFDGPELTPSDPPPPPPLPELLHQWTFNGSLEDTVGNAHGIVSGGAEMIDNRLFVDGQPGSRFLTSPLGQDINAKTMVAWVSLSDVNDSTRGSALTIENTPTGNIFDAIVYGEVAERKWMAGSNNFARTDNPQSYGVEETVGEPGEVMLSIVYDTDNSITLYRDGVEYGSYTKGSLQPYGPGAVAQIGPRHGAHNDVFNGFVNEARIYGGALSDVEVLDLFFEGPSIDPNPLPPEPPADGLIHQWTFESGTAKDSRGSADGELFGGATIENGRLLLDGIDDYMRTSPIDFSINAKSLVSWVSLDNLDQGAGSALTIEHPSGTDTFDGIVFGERVAGQWMAGSNFFQRSVEDNGGPGETVTEPGEVMVAIVYADDGSIIIYRDGVEYASAANTSKGSIVPYVAGVADVLIGVRHEDIAGGSGTVDGSDAFLAGFINEARIYNFALNESEILDVFIAGTATGQLGDFNGDGQFDVSDIDALAAEIATGGTDTTFDMNADGAIDISDLDRWRADAATVNGFASPYLPGDADLNGTVEAGDLNRVGIHWRSETTLWSNGDFNADGFVDAADLNELGLNWQASVPVAAAPVPEPGSVLPIVLWAVAIVLTLRR